MIKSDIQTNLYLAKDINFINEKESNCLKQIAIMNAIKTNNKSITITVYLYFLFCHKNISR